METEGYIQYRRPDDGGTIHLPGGKVVDNRNIVAYSPFLSLKYNCHFNVEVVHSMKAVKYLFKYLHKGGDRASINLRTAKAQSGEILS